MKTQRRPTGRTMITIGAVLVPISLALLPIAGEVQASEWTPDLSAESILFSMINNERTSIGARRLTRDPELDRLARHKALDMAQNGYFSHVSPRLGTVYDQLLGAGKNYKWAGENIARASSAVTAHHALMDSPDHRANILSAGYTHVGIGVVEHQGRRIVAQIFMRPR